ncbi:DUF481 domain-containing protein [Robiginitalea sp. SC105]|uniref:DUF481 domain-containing protein n=1 Tax=Robiginitalea sp. SC105 TaxID=2762332 RepID=UPI00163AEFD9|nr:DUF481 domain-containing protein [Robiginitalea sp. SC105]MBC2838831.1 DUF481 domain-containing protein [Robiginitalea sp. SC105]
MMALLLGLATVSTRAQNDTLRLKNGNVLHGEIKGLVTGVLTMETPYSDDDFTIDYEEVSGLSLERQSIVILAGGRRVVGNLRSAADGEVTIRTEEEGTLTVALEELTSLQQVKRRFLNRFDGYIDLGFNLTKANNNRQFTSSIGIHYRGVKWIGDFDVSTLRSERDEVAKVERNSGTLALTYLLSDKWYVLASTAFLSNTEQQLDGRWSLRAGPGRFLAISNRLVWGLGAGINYNVENFAGQEFDIESTEAFVTTNFNMHGFGDFSLNTRLDFYPSLSESGRIRADYLLDVQYDLPWDFYVKTGFQFNYDNQAIVEGSQFDYILTSGFGWSFD